MDQLKERRKSRKLHVEEDGTCWWLDEPLFSPLYYAFFKDVGHARLAWELWHSSRIF